MSGVVLKQAWCGYFGAGALYVLDVALGRILGRVVRSVCLERMLYFLRILLKLMPVCIFALSLHKAYRAPLSLMKSSKAWGPSLSVLMPKNLVNLDCVPTKSWAHVMPPRPTSDEKRMSVAKV
eukprot:13107413-Ditylum_brightwellii.AAC.1